MRIRSTVGGGMRITFECVPEDFQAANEIMCGIGGKESPPLWRRARLDGVLLLVVLVGGAYWVLADGERDLDWPAVMLMVVSIVFGLMCWLMMLIKSMQPPGPAPDGSFCARQDCSVDDDGISFVSDLIETRVGWRAVRHFDEDAWRYFLFVDDCYTYVIPKRAFETPEQAKEFSRLCRMKTGGGPWQR